MSVVRKLMSVLPSSWIGAASGLHWRFPILRRFHESIANRYRSVDGVIERGAGRGLRFNAGGSYAGYLLGTWEPVIQKAFETFLKPGDIIYDGGASVGYWSVLTARLVGPSGRVVSFEPLLANVERIVYNARLNGMSNVEVRREALGAADGTATFLVSADAGWGRLGEHGSSLAQKVSEIDASVRSIDSLVAAGEIPAPNVVKLDVEGAEVAVLRGAATTLRAARPVLLIELHDTGKEVAQILAQLDYATEIASGNVIAVPRENGPQVEKLLLFRS